MKTGTLVAKDDHSIEILGTCETILGCALVAAAWLNEAGELQYDHAGETEMFWDSSTTETRDGMSVFQDDGGNEYTEDEVVILYEDGTVGEPKRASVSVQASKAAARTELYRAALPLAELVESFTGSDSEHIAVTVAELRALAAACDKVREGPS